MSGKFRCIIPDGFDATPGGEHIAPGHRYDVWAYSDEQIERWIAKGLIEMVE